MNSSNRNRLSVPEVMQIRYQEIVTLTDALCLVKLNSEYSILCRELTAALSRKRPSPLLSGQVNTWACGITYTIGFVNFLFDKTQIPYMRANDLCEWFGVAASTGGNKAKQIRDMLRISQFSSKWMLPSRISESPWVWMVSYNGFEVDVRRLPKSIQEEAFRKGLIPYLPGISNIEE